MRAFKIILLCLCAALIFSQCTKINEPTNQLDTSDSTQVITPDSTNIVWLNTSDLHAQMDSAPIELNVQVTSPQAGQSVLSWIMGNIPAWVIILGFVGEILSRLLPTSTNIANFKWLSNLLQLVFGNRKLGGGSF